MYKSCTDHSDLTTLGAALQIMEDAVLDSYGSLSDSQPLQQVPLSLDEISTKEKLKLLCKPTYKIRRVKTKGALLVLAWTFLAASVFWCIMSTLSFLIVGLCKKLF